MNAANAECIETALAALEASLTEAHDNAEMSNHAYTDACDRIRLIKQRVRDAAKQL